MTAVNFAVIISVLLFIYRQPLPRCKMMTPTTAALLLPVFHHSAICFAVVCSDNWCFSF